MDYSNANICRICLNAQDTLFSLFRKRHGTSPYEILISKTKLNIQLNDSGPPSICSQCLIDLDTTACFLDKCERSNQLLSAVFTEHSDSKVRLESESDTKLTYEPQEVEDEDVSGVEVKSSEAVSEEQCGECGSKRRCGHWAPPTVHTCQYCQKTFNKKYNYKQHVARHVGSARYACGGCGAELRSRWAAARHCAGVRRRACPVPACARSFTTTTNLAIHFRTHSGERPFECDDCGKTFISKNILNNHMRTHTGVKPYMCQVCGKQFATNKLSVHMLSHSAGGAGGAGGRVHACARAECTRSFASARALREHARTHAAHRAYACALCDCSYKFKQSLNYHVKNAHGVGAKIAARPDVANPMTTSVPTLNDNIVKECEL